MSTFRIAVPYFAPNQIKTNKEIMKRIILTYGAINAAIMACLFAITTAFREQIGFENGMIVGYTNIILGKSCYYDSIFGCSLDYSLHSFT